MYFKRALRALYPLAAASLLLTSCGPRDQAYNPVHFGLRGMLVPPEVIGTAPGLFPIPANLASSSLCCWLGKDAELLVRKRGASRRLSLTIYVPDLPALSQGRQSLVVYFPPYRGAAHFAHLSTGFQTEVVAVPNELITKVGKIRVRLQAGVTLPPDASAARGPQYALILTSLYFDS